MKRPNFNEPVEYVVPRILDPRYGWMYQLPWSLPIFIALTVVSPMFTDLYIRLAIETAIPHWEEWGPALAGMGGALGIGALSALIGARSVGGVGQSTKARRRAALWGKIFILALTLVLSGGIASARFAQGLMSIRHERHAAHQQARADMLAARNIVKDSEEARVARKNLARGARMVEEGRRNRWPSYRRDGMRMQARAQETLTRLQKQVDGAVAEAQRRMEKSKAVETIPTEEVLRLVVGPTLTEIAWTEVLASMCFFLAIMCAQPLVRVTREEYLELLRREEEQEAAEEAARRERAVQKLPPPPPSPEPDEPSMVVLEEDEDLGVDDEPQVESTIPLHPTMRGVDLAYLDEKSLKGLEPQLGTWCGLPLGEPARRRIDRGRGPWRLWPTLNVRAPDGRPIFIGSIRAIRMVAAEGSAQATGFESNGVS